MTGRADRVPISALKLALMAREARAQSQALLNADPIAIIGMACRYPGGGLEVLDALPAVPQVGGGPLQVVPELVFVVHLKSPRQRLPMRDVVDRARAGAVTDRASARRGGAGARVHAEGGRPGGWAAAPSERPGPGPAGTRGVGSGQTACSAGSLGCGTVRVSVGEYGKNPSNAEGASDAAATPRVDPRRCRPAAAPEGSAMYWRTMVEHRMVDRRPGRRAAVGQWRVRGALAHASGSRPVLRPKAVPSSAARAAGAALPGW